MRKWPWVKVFPTNHTNSFLWNAHERKIKSTIALYDTLLCYTHSTGETTMLKITNEKEALAAVRQDGRAFKYVPENLRTLELKEKIDSVRDIKKEKLIAEMRKKIINCTKEFEEFLKYAKSQWITL